jgi:hypothetical protein
MDILRSNKEHKVCIGGAYIFSGRPDPTWEVGEVVLKKLKKIWDGLSEWVGELPSTPPLGYRGCFIGCKPDIEWFAYGGIVTLKTVEGRESRMDKNRNIERLLLYSAPEGILPEGIL